MTFPRTIRDCFGSSERTFEIVLFEVRVLSGQRLDFALLVLSDMKDICLVAPFPKLSHAVPPHAHTSGLCGRHVAAQGSFSLCNSLKNHVQD